jgi:hypothetical protein
MFLLEEEVTTHDMQQMPARDADPRRLKRSLLDVRVPAPTDPANQQQTTAFRVNRQKE